MVAYVLGHGWHDSGAPPLVVPAGMTISFLADFDLSGMQHIQAAQLFVGGVAAAQTYQAGDQLPNYEFAPLSDDWVARMHGLNIHDLDLWMIGPEVPAFALCTGTDGLCSADAHACVDGLLGLAQQNGQDHLHIMSCRVDVAQAPHTWGADDALHDDAGGADTTFHTELIAWTSWFLTLGFAEQRATWTALSYEEQLQRTTDGELGQWAEVYEAVLQYEAHGAAPEFHAYYDSLDGAVRERILRDHPDVAAAVRARPDKQVPPAYLEIIEQFLLTSPDDQDTYWRDLDPGMRELFVMDTRMNDWAQAYAARDYLSLGITDDTFRGYCAKLSDGAVDLLLQYDGPRAILTP